MIEHAAMKIEVDVGAFRCPRWFAEGLMALIALEAAEQGKCSKEAAEKEATDWLVANGFEKPQQATEDYPGQAYFHAKNPNIRRAEENWERTHG